MKLSPLFAAAILAGVAFAPNAQASDVNFNGPNYNMGTVATGQTGTIATNPKTVTGGAEYALASGTLSPDTEIVFTYTGIPGTTAPKVLTAIGTYIDSGLTYYTTSQDNGSGAITVAYSIDPGLPPGRNGAFRLASRFGDCEYRLRKNGHRKSFIAGRQFLKLFKSDKRPLRYHGNL
jgi:hypothetical protein